MTGSIVLDASQQRAVELVCTARVGIVTGGPGTGKTTIMRVALERLDRRGVRYALASPTGKAAKRLSEATDGRTATTLHRLLEYKPSVGFQRNAEHPLDRDLVIVDESSMVDTPLMAALMRAVTPQRTRVILVGDANQLPPVGPGRPFGDLVEWGHVPTVRLEVLHRTATTSWIHLAAQDLLAGRVPALEPRADFRWVECNDPVWILPKLQRLVTEVFGPGGKLEAEAQVLIPQRPGVAGIEAANVVLQQALNPRRVDARVWQRGKWEIREGDLVIQTRNDYDLEVFNGEIGRVVGIGGGGVTVTYPGHDAPSSYGGDKVAALQLAYSLTIHRTQGSEFGWAIVVCHSTHAFILSRQLLYTAITRAKVGVVLVGDRRGLERAVANTRTDARNTTLVDRLDDTLEPVEQYQPPEDPRARPRTNATSD
jgi:exodeoxyribonuclease V alpha subunit